MHKIEVKNITSHKSSSIHRHSVKNELAGQESQTIGSINPMAPKKLIEQAFACLYFLTK